ncbi:hypothetical protein [Streptomyces sp. 6-11-2]|nr:hypothetical protein [Streptomyces sp. 6-11-2]
MTTSCSSRPAHRHGRPAAEGRNTMPGIGPVLGAAFLAATGGDMAA